MKPKYKSPEFRWGSTIRLHLYAYLRTVWWCCTEAGWTVWPSWLLTGNQVRDIHYQNFCLKVCFFLFLNARSMVLMIIAELTVTFFHISTKYRKKTGSCHKELRNFFFNKLTVECWSLEGFWSLDSCSCCMRITKLWYIIWTAVHKARSHDLVPGARTADYQCRDHRAWNWGCRCPKTSSVVVALTKLHL